MALFLQFRTKSKRNTFTNPSLFHFYSSSNSTSDKPESTATATSSDDTPSSSYFSNVKKFLKQEQSSPSIFTLRNPSSSSFTASGTSNPTPFKASNIDEIRQHLRQYRRGVSESKSDSTPPSSPSSDSISFEKIYRRNVEGKSSELMSDADLRHAKVGGRLGFDAIRESVRSRRHNAQPSGSSTLIGGTASPASVFGKELRENEKSGEMKKAFLKTYRHEELGERLKKLRPPAKGGDWFSLKELKDRLVKLREMDEMESNAKSTSDANPYGYFRDAFYTLKDSENQEKKSRLS